MEFVLRKIQIFLVLNGDISETPRRLQIQEEHREVHQREHREGSQGKSPNF